jgi:Mrp family chromosome partitioning ATPase
MSRMLQALRQIEAKSQWSVPSPGRGCSADDDVRADVADAPVEETPGNAICDVLPPLAAPLDLFAIDPAEAVAPDTAATIEPTPATLDAVGDAERSLAQAESALAEAAAPLDDAGAAELADPYSVLADTILAQVSPVGSAVLMFTSAGDGEGKTVTLARLAAAMAKRLQGNILVIDANLRKPGLAARFGVHSAQGLTDVLAGKTLWSQAVQKTAMRRLSVLPSGYLIGGNGSPSDMLAMEPLLAELREHYRMVLIDTPSLLYSEVADMAAWCDATYLVARLGSTNRRALAEAAAILEQFPGRLRGCVVVD